MKIKTYFESDTDEELKTLVLDNFTTFLKSYDLSIDEIMINGDSNNGK